MNTVTSLADRRVKELLPAKGPIDICLITSERLPDGSVFFRYAIGHDPLCCADIEFLIDDEKGFMHQRAVVSEDGTNVVVTLNTDVPVIRMHMQLAKDGKQSEVRFQTKRVESPWHGVTLASLIEIR